MIIEDKETLKLLHEKHNLIREYDKSGSEMSEKVFKNKLSILNHDIIKSTNSYIEKQLGSKGLAEENKMSEEVVEKTVVEKVKKVKEARADSYAAVIYKVLQMKTVKNINQATDLVDEKKPGRDKKKIKTQIAAMIRETIAGKKPKYTWNAEEFQLSEVVKEE